MLLDIKVGGWWPIGPWLISGRTQSESKRAFLRTRELLNAGSEVLSTRVHPKDRLEVLKCSIGYFHFGLPVEKLLHDRADSLPWICLSWHQTLCLHFDSDMRRNILFHNRSSYCQVPGYSTSVEVLSLDCLNTACRVLGTLTLSLACSLLTCCCLHYLDRWARLIW